MKIDLHCHSKFSKRPSLWLMKRLGCPESFTEPRDIYHLARRQGMSAITITDHNVIDGCLEIADRPDTFISCEYTTYFPEDRCKVHVLAYNINEAHHRDLSKARENIYDLVDYLHAHSIPHVCAHPLFWVNDRLTMHHIEQLVLLFENWEWNGDLAPELNEGMRRLLRALTPEMVKRLADKHGIEPRGPEMWRKRITAGSDDHSSLHIATSYTKVPGANSIEEFWNGVKLHHARIQVHTATPEAFARSVYSTAYQFYKDKAGLASYVNKDVFLRFLEGTLLTPSQEPESWGNRFTMFIASRRRLKKPDPENRSLLDLARFEAECLIREDPQLMALVTGSDYAGDIDQKWFDFVNKVSNKVLMSFGERILDRVMNARLLDLFHSIGSAGALYVILAPYFLAYSHYTRQRVFADEVAEHFELPAVPGSGTRPRRVAHFTDTFHEVNGVSRTLQQQVDTARELDKDYRVITCVADKQPRREGVYQFLSVGAYQLPEYPELELLAPPLLQMLEHCYQERITHIHVSTPGPVGLAGLLVGRILQIPVTGTYHTAFPQYAKALTEDSYVEDMLWKCMLWFYEALDAIFVPSRATGDELTKRGVAPDRLRVYPRGVDHSRFRPENRSDVLARDFGLSENGGLTLLYVGRISREKNLHLLTEAFIRLHGQSDSVRLVVVGDGPYRDEMEQRLQGAPVLFTGYLNGHRLDEVYASCDLMVFPSTTDTFGNVVLEAQASGTPVIVTDMGGPQENIIHGETGLIVPGNHVETLLDAMRELTRDPARLEAMRAAARRYAQTRGFAQAFEQLYDMYTDSQDEAQRSHLEHEVIASTLAAAGIAS